MEGKKDEVSIEGRFHLLLFTFCYCLKLLMGSKEGEM